MASRQKQLKPASASASEGDYCSYITAMARKTSMCEGPHFPNLFKQSANRKADVVVQEKTYTTRTGPSAVQEKTYTTRTGRFGRAEHID